jgi:long-chain acyl-CoA synthetase
MNLAALLSRSAINHRNRPAIRVGVATLSDYGALGERVARIATGLRGNLGLQTGDRIAIAMKNCPEFIEIMFACWHAGLAVAPMNAKLHPREFAYILENSGARACFVTDDLAAAITDAAGDVPGFEAIIRAGSQSYDELIADTPASLADVAPDDLAWLFYTSGTTGRPKGAMLTHRNLMAMTMSYFTDVDQVTADDSIIHAAPMSHGSGLYIPPHIAKGACNVIPMSGGFEPDEIFALLPDTPGATFFFAPTMVTRLINASGMAAADTSNLKTIVYGGGPMYAEDSLRAMDALGPKLVQIYGQGESPMTITCLTRADHMNRDHPCFMDRLASVGAAHSVVEVMTVDEDDRQVPPGEIGEILVRGDAVMAGYWRNEAASAETLRGGWLHTGDMGAFDDDGYLTLKDRSKDVIISGGTNIYPREVEEVLLRHENVLEASVVGRPHDDWGEEIVAFIVARPDTELKESELDTLCLENIARFKRPKAYRFIDELPKNNYGKILKTDLRALLD